MLLMIDSTNNVNPVKIFSKNGSMMLKTIKDLFIRNSYNRNIV